MKKMRIYELAKSVNKGTKEVIKDLAGMGIEVKSHMSSLEGAELEKAMKFYEAGKEPLKTETDQKTEKRQEPKAQPKKSQEPKTKKKAEERPETRSNAPQPSQKKENARAEAPAKKEKNNKPNKPQKPQNAKAQGKKESKKKQVRPAKPAPEIKEVEIEDEITVLDFAKLIGKSVAEVISKLITLGVMANQNQKINFDYASLIGDEFGVTVKLKEQETDSDDPYGLDYEDREEDLVLRSPVVTVMGHVDHGKTSLLDAIRKTSVTKREAGGITQHIGASTVNVNGKRIVFLDTPGHEAFTAMRSRGAMVTDIAVLVVAADDGVMPQTIEAINHAKAANVPIIVAVNKMDKPEANIDRIRQELTEQDLVVEAWGGDVIDVPVSARNGDGIDDLLEMILMVAEMEELKANPNRKAVGTIVEAQLDKGRGPVATVLVQKGTLKSGDMVVTGKASGRIRAMFDDKGKKINKAKPSTPVVILGLSDVPEAGDMIYAVKDEKTARSIAQAQREHEREEKMNATSRVSLDDIFSKIQEGNLKELNIVIKTDVRGTIDAVKQSLEKLSNDEVRVNIIHGAVGGVTESDVMLASASNAVIIGFNVRPTQVAIDMAKQENIDMRTYRVIYDAINDIEAAIEGMLEPKYKEVVLGRAEVRQVFKIPGAGNVAGIYVKSGVIRRSASVRLMRDNVVLYEGEINSLKRFKDDARELATNFEGGLGLENYNDIKVGDEIEAYVMEEIK